MIGAGKPDCFCPPQLLKKWLGSFFLNYKEQLIFHKNDINGLDCKDLKASIDFKETFYYPFFSYNPTPVVLFCRSKCHYISWKKMDQRSMRDVETIDQERGKNQLINDQSERHCTLSGRFLGIGSAVTYLWGFWAFVAVSEDAEVSAPSTCPRPWNLAKRLMTENFSRSWHSTLKSNIEALFSSLHHQEEAIENMRERERE